MVSFSTRGSKDRQEFTLSNWTIIRILVLVVIFLALVSFFRQISDALLIILVSFFLALALNMPVHWLAQKLPHRRGRDRRTAATVISFVIVVIVLGGFIAAIVPPIVSQTKNFVNNIPSYVDQVQNRDSDFSQFVRRYNLQPEVQKFSDGVKSNLNDFTGTLVDGVATLARSIVVVLTVLVMTFMMLIEGPKWFRNGARLLNEPHRRYLDQIAADMYKVVRGYVNGQVILAAIAAALIAPALFILHISYPIALIFVIFICGLIPFVGHTIGAVIVAIVALFHSPIAAIIILAYYILYINIENYVIQPRLQSITTNMTPLTVFVAVVVGVNFGGVIGGLLAIPVAGCVQVLIVDYIRRKNLMGAAGNSASRSQ